MSSNQVIDAINERAAATIRQLTTAQLVEAFAITEGDNADHIPNVRGWIMDALEEREPAAFLKWLDDNGRNMAGHFGV